MKLPSILSRRNKKLRTPAPLAVPALESARVCWLYHQARLGGDFFDAVLAGGSRFVFLLMDIAGERARAFHLAAYVQDEFRGRVPELFTGSVNESEALSQLCLGLNRNLLDTAGRAHMTAAFLGVFQPEIGILTYINAGHIPGLLLSPGSTEMLESVGMPLGLFSHATHEASIRVIPPGGALLLASRGIVEARSENGVFDRIGRVPEFGLEGLCNALTNVERVAQPLCRTALDSAIMHAGRRIDNDMTVAVVSRDE